jgi:hypothetical protein
MQRRGQQGARHLRVGPVGLRERLTLTVVDLVGFPLAPRLPGFPALARRIRHDLFPFAQRRVGVEIAVARPVAAASRLFFAQRRGRIYVAVPHVVSILVHRPLLVTGGDGIAVAAAVPVGISLAVPELFRERGGRDEQDG